MSMPIHRRFNFCATWTVVPQKRIENYVTFVGGGAEDSF